MASAATASATAAVLADHASAVGQYFGSVRVPSSFIAGASFAGLFTVKAPSEQTERIENLHRYIYHFCIIVAFLLAINTVMVSTAAYTKNLHGDFDPISTSGYMLLKREFEYEFTMTRWSFIVALLSFLVATANRILYEFKLFSLRPTPNRQRRRIIGTAVCLLMSSLIFHLLAFLNSTLICWNSLADMTIDLLKLIVKKGSWKKPLEPLSLVAATTGIGSIIYAFLFIKDEPAQPIQGSKRQHHRKK